MNAAFDRFANWASGWLSKPIAFLLALALVLAWLAGGPHYEWNDSYSLIINSVTTIITFLMAFLILSSTARENAAIEAKLDELIRAIPQARNDMVGVEARTAEEIAVEARRVQDDARLGK